MSCTAAFYRLKKALFYKKQFIFLVNYSYTLYIHALLILQIFPSPDPFSPTLLSSSWVQTLHRKFCPLHPSPSEKTPLRLYLCNNPVEYLRNLSGVHVRPVVRLLARLEAELNLQEIR